MIIAPGVSLIASGGLGASLTSHWDCNAYAVRVAAGDWWIFDAGCGYETGHLEAQVAANGIRPTRLFVSHGHLDHSGGAAWWRERFGVEVCAGAQTAEWLSQGDEESISLPAARKLGTYPEHFRMKPCVADRTLSAGDVLTAPDAEVAVIETPGHACDMLSFLVRRSDGSRLLLSADNVFHGGKVALLSTWDSDVLALGASLRALAACDFETLLPGHGIWSLRDGKRHVLSAVECFDRLALPPSL